MRNTLAWIGALGLLLVAPAGFADVWDVSSTDDDDSSTTDNELVHGSVQIHDLGAAASVADQDWFKVTTFAYSSHEVIMEGVTGDISNGQDLDRVTSAGSIINSGIGLPGGSGYSLSLRWQNQGANTTNQFIRVSGAQCSTACTVADQYTVRYYETSTSVARFNNAGSQVTSLLLQNPSTYPINGRVFLWNGAGALVGEQGIFLAPKALINLNTATIAPGSAGSITITHDGRYGDLQGKSVALEPATGFSFDTPMVYRPH